jgi:hypothetical protein
VSRSGGGTHAVPAKVAVHTDLPAKLQRDVTRLQQVVAQK